MFFMPDICSICLKEGGKSKLVEDTADSVRKWVSSPDGQKEIQRVLENSKEMVSKLREARKVDFESLHEPFTI